MSEQTPAPQPPIEFRRTEDFVSTYANNVQFEISAWDLKVIFGELDQRAAGKLAVDQHTAVTLSWPLAKLFSYFLEANIAVYEGVHGKIKLDSEIRPPVPGELPGQLAGYPGAKAILQTLQELHKQFIDSL